MEAAETSFGKEVDAPIAAFQNLKEYFPPEIVSGIYRLADTQLSAFLSNEFVSSAETLQNGVSAEDIIKKRADNGRFEGSMMPMMIL